MQPRFIALGLVAAASALLLSGCSTAASTTGSSASAGDIKSIYMVNPLPAYPDWATFDTCFMKRTKELGIKGTTAGPTGMVPDNAFSIDRISQAITQKYDAVLMVPIEPAQFNPLMQRAKAAGMVVGTINTGDATSLQDFSVGTDYPTYGANVAKSIGEIEGQQELLVVTNGPGGTGDVIVDSLKKSLPSNVKLVDVVFDSGDPAQTADVVSRSITAHPEITAVWSWEATAVAGITTAIKEKGLTGKVVGVVNDLTDQSISGLREGTIYGASKQNFCDMATKAVDFVVAKSKGEKVAKITDTGTTFVTKANLDSVLDAEPK